MIFESRDFYINTIENNDIEEICEIYNSNEHFLLNHMNVNNVTSKWMLVEITCARKTGFKSCKIVDKASGKKIGIVDFKFGEETYLSLLMIHNDFRGKGIGKVFFINFEEYLKSLKGKSIRIDVGTGYDNSVFDFWDKNGFISFQDVKLNWAGNILSAVTMRKYL